ncbi:MAG: ABC transporter ATP-binding protein [Tissierellia bacterium]|nr:ABC transporter ATP-binding protein [Tissierellia bacterium]
MICLNTECLCLGYGNRCVVNELDLEIKRGSIVSIIGPNGSGKSTILKAFAKLLAPNSGDIVLNGTELRSMSNKKLAQCVSMLLQRNVCPADLKVRDLLYYGRLPHKKWYETKDDEDMKIIERAMQHTGIKSMAEKRIAQLSGGESQRVWLAMAIAQEPQVLLLDEPTTYLDIGYQLELLELIKDLNWRLKTTVIMVLHDLNQAAKYSDYIYVLKEGCIYDYGKPKDVISGKMLMDVYRVEGDILYDEGIPIVLPKTTRRSS